MPDLPLHSGSRWDNPDDPQYVIDRVGNCIEWISTDRASYLQIRENEDEDSDGFGAYHADVLAVLNRAGLLDSLFAERDKTIAELNSEVATLTRDLDASGQVRGLQQIDLETMHLAIVKLRARVAELERYIDSQQSERSRGVASLLETIDDHG
jgi:hypothetical protein